MRTLTPTERHRLRRLPAGSTGNRVQAAIDMVGGTQRDLARRSGVSFTFVADIARGRYQTTSVRTANRLAIALDCSIEDLFPLVDDAPKVGAR